MKDIKVNPITESELNQMKDLIGDFESLFSRRAMKYRQLGLDKKVLNESDYKDLILKEYTFLKRPVFVLENKKIFVGSSKSTIENLKKEINN